ncbi:MAG: helix-turn-helix transcriptional regulator [Dehalococcoidia bacterium]
MSSPEPTNPGTSHPPIEGRNGSLFYSETEAAARLGLHRTTLRALALAGRAPVEPIPLTEHRRVYRRTDIHRLAGLQP